MEQQGPRTHNFRRKRYPDLAGTSIWIQLPPELLQRVVSLLPVVALFKFRVVCKQWNAWISELHPQTPDQKAEIILLPDYGHPWLGANRWRALDTSIDKWYKIKRRFMCTVPSTAPYFEVSLTDARAAHEGLVCIEVTATNGEVRLLVWNPVVKLHEEEIPCESVIKDLYSHQYYMVVDNNTKSYKLYVLARVRGVSGRVVVRVYDSNDKLWRAVCTIPSMPASYSSSMAVGGEFLHILLRFIGPERRRILSYNMKEESWAEHAASDIPLFLRDDILIYHLLMYQSRLLLVGAVGAESNHENNAIFIWETSFGEKEEVVIAQMPDSIYRSLGLTMPINILYSGKLAAYGSGNRIFFLSGRSKIGIYCISNNSWHLPPDMDESLPRFVRCAPFEKFTSLTVA